MAIFSWTAAGKTVGATPAEWVGLKNVASIAIANDAAGNHLLVTAADALTTYAQFTPPGSANSDVEILAKTNTTLTMTSRVDTATPIDSYIRIAVSDTQISGAAVNDGVGVGSIGSSITNNINFPTMHYLKMQFIGNTWRYKEWEEGSAEPNLWEYERATLERLAAGAVGLYSFGGTMKVYEYEVRTGTDMEGFAAPEPSLTVTPADLPLTPGGTISGTYSNYATIPTTLTVSDGTNTITIASPTITDNGDGTGSFSGTMPAMPTTGTANLVLFGDVTVELA